jgi:hypothetical protein
MTDTLKSICEQCVHLRNPQLDFILSTSKRQRDIIERDLRELVSAASHELEKAVVILAGGLFESALYSFIQAQSGYLALRRPGFQFRPDYGLPDFVNTFNRWFSAIHRIPGVVVEYRDLVHINRELQQPVDFCRKAAEDMLVRLDALLGKLRGYPAI